MELFFFGILVAAAFVANLIGLFFFSKPKDLTTEEMIEQMKILGATDKEIHRRLYRNWW